jgi:hypothetical protein
MSYYICPKCGGQAMHCLAHTCPEHAPKAMPIEYGWTPHRQTANDDAQDKRLTALEARLEALEKQIAEGDAMDCQTVKLLVGRIERLETENAILKRLLGWEYDKGNNYPAYVRLTNCTVATYPCQEISKAELEILTKEDSGG